MRYSLTIFLLLIFSACEKDDIFTIDPNQEFSKNLQKLADDIVGYGLPGYIMLVDHPIKGFHIIESGKANLEDETILHKDHLFHSASLMKTFTAVCAFQLHEKALLNVDDEISLYLPEEIIAKIPNGNVATIKSLMNHSSGIPDFALQSNYIEDLISYTNGGPEPRNVLEYIKDLNPDFITGSDHLYCNTGYYILQLIIAEKSGLLFEEYLYDNIIKPLALVNTFYREVPTSVDYARVPDYYIDWDNNRMLTKSTKLENEATKTFEGFSGLLATVEDYYKFIKALFVDGTLLSRESIEKMKKTNHNIGFGYGTGLEVIKSDSYPDKYGHKGGTQASFFYYPEEGTFLLTMANYSFVDGASPFDQKGIVPDELGKAGNIVGEVEQLLFD